MDGGKLVKFGEKGEFCIYSENIMMGYYVNLKFMV